MPQTDPLAGTQQQQQQNTGLIANAMAPANEPASYGYQAAQVNMTDADRVDEDVARIIQKNSALTQTARTGAQQQWNARGLVGSTMALEAGEQAAINSALPMAHQNVSNRLSVATTNANADNTSRQFGASARNTALNLQTQGTQAIQQVQEQGAQSRQNISLEGQIGKERDALQAGYAMQRDQKLHDYAVELQKLVDAGQLTAKEAQARIDAEAAKVGQGYELEKMQFGATLEQQRDAYLGNLQKERDAILNDYAVEQQAAAHMNEMDKAAYLANIEKKRDERLAALQRREIALTHANTLEEITAQGDVQQMLQAAQHSYSIDEIKTQGDIQSTRDRINNDYQWMVKQAEFVQEDKRDQFLTDAQTARDNNLAALNERSIKLQGEIDERITNLKTESDKTLQKMQIDYQKVINTSGQAAQLFSYTQDAIAQILANPDIPIGNKQALVDQNRNLLQQGLQLIGGITDTDLSAFIGTGGGGTGGGVPPPGGGVPGGGIGGGSGGVIGGQMGGLGGYEYTGDNMLPSNFNVQGYLNKYPDIKRGYDSQSTPRGTLEEYARWHYLQYGVKEGRTAP